MQFNLLSAAAILFVLPAHASTSFQDEVPKRLRAVSAAVTTLEQGLARIVDPVFKEYDSKNSPGCSVAVYRNGQIAYARGYGMADLEHAVPNEPRSIFRIGSTSKQFTAACVVLLHLRNKLSLDDDIRKWLPQMPDYGRKITIRNLMHHTSGIRDYLGLMWFAGKSGADFYTDAEVIAKIARQRELNFAPGSEFLYSNSGYFLLAHIVEAATGKSLREAADELIFAPLGMRETHYHDNHRQLVAHRAEGYAPSSSNGGFQISRTTLEMIGDGGVFTSVEDLLKWDRNFYDPKIGGPEFLALMRQTGKLTSGKALKYAGGLLVGNYRGLRAVSHGGANVGYQADIIRFPDQSVTIVCLANVSTANPTKLCREVADGILASQLAPRPASAKPSAAVAARAKSGSTATSENATKPAVISAALATKLAGSWKDEPGSLQVRFTAKNGELRAQLRGRGFRLASTGLQRVALIGPSTLLEFELVSDGPDASKVVVYRAGKKAFTLASVPPVQLTADQVRSFAGSFFSDELEATWVIALREGKLHLCFGRKFDRELVPTTKDSFAASGLKLRFDRGANDSVVGFHVDAQRVRNLRFTVK
ncbi:MAG: CubicO group peptidase (beta-lactamase class C family) [Planctomycetota bacterium]|jgi:CubicO group peptidase (beta-lactamase class C family)